MTHNKDISGHIKKHHCGDTELVILRHNPETELSLNYYNLAIVGLITNPCFCVLYGFAEKKI